MLSIAFALGFAAALMGIYAFEQEKPSPTPVCALAVQTLFSPKSQDRFVALMDSAESSLDVMLYQFSNPAMKDALASAVARGVKVRIILEPRVGSNYDTAAFLAQNGVEVRWATKNYTNTHSKTIVIDGNRVIVGSTNWSRQAMASNRESSVVIESAELASQFQAVFEEDWAKASDYVSGVPTPSETFYPG